MSPAQEKAGAVAESAPPAPASASAVPAPAATANLRGLAAVLVERGWVRVDEIEAALQVAERTGERVGTILVRRGRITDMQLAEALAVAYQMPWTALDEREVDVDALRNGVVSFETAETSQVIPLLGPTGQRRLGMADPGRLDIIDQLRRAGVRVSPVIVPASRLSLVLSRLDPEDPKTKINRLIQRAQGTTVAADEGYVLQLTKVLLTQAMQVGASDIHIEPDQTTVRVRLRIDGVLTQVYTFPGNLHQTLINAIKIAASMDISVRHLPQDGRLVHHGLGRTIDVRVATYPGVYGEHVVLRLLDKLTALRPLEDIGYTAPLLERMRGILTRPHGIFLVTGPTGSGKTTTLYACLVRMTSSEVSIMTIEDPVEYELALVKQAQMDEKAGFTFENALRSMLRADPDVILVGEIRDAETAALACQAALTGHLVLSTLHTNSAPEAISRLLEFQVQRHVLAAALRGIVGQRLVRRVCPACARRRPPTEDEAGWFRDALGEVPLSVPEAVGCERCRKTGYAGRTAIAEFFAVTPQIQDSIATGESLGRLMQQDPGYKPLAFDGLEKVAQGQTTIAEVMRVAEWQLLSRVSTT